MFDVFQDPPAGPSAEAEAAQTVKLIGSSGAVLDEFELHCGVMEVRSSHVLLV